jgi:hypothetical protein
MRLRLLLLLLMISTNGDFALAQSSDFTYQGRLVQNSLPANGTYDFEFKLYNAAAGGALADTKLRNAVPVANGVFTVRLDFAAALFDGSDRYLEIGVRTAGSGGGYQQLLPRQQITSTPYALRSLTATTATNSSQLGGVAASQYVLTGDSRLIDSRNPLPNNPNYIQNRETLQTTSNFNISGNGQVGGTFSADAVNATTHFTLATSPVLHSPGTNFFVGRFNSQLDSLTGGNNSFFGISAGQRNTSGSRNSYFGRDAGLFNLSSNDNSFFGFQAGLNSEAANNSFFGSQSGSSNVGGSNNTLIGSNTGVGSANLTFATAIGAGAVVSNNSSVVLGRTADTVRIPGALNVTGSTILNNTLLASATAIFADNVAVQTLGSAGSTDVCRNATNFLSTCSSSLRYKRDIHPFTAGLSLVNRLHPIRFSWTGNGLLDIGFGAEEVEKVEPLLVVYNNNGQVEGVKYRQLTAVLVNAIREQQAHIELQETATRKLHAIVNAQQKQIADLKQLVCLDHPNVEICK